jgi:hypothetical protein
MVVEIYHGLGKLNIVHEVCLTNEKMCGRDKLAQFYPKKHNLKDIMDCYIFSI